MTLELELFNHDVSFFFFFSFILKMQRERQTEVVWFVCVLAFLSSALILQVGLPIITGGCGCRGSTTLAPHAQCSLCSFYSCQPTDSLLPVMYSKQCCCFFFTVWCLFSVPLAHAAVNRLLEKLLFFLKKKEYFDVFGWSQPGAMSVSVAGRCESCRL